MDFPERFSNLPDYAFPRLRSLLDAHAPGGDVLHMTIGEPRHEFPEWIGEILAEHTAEFGKYPPNEGSASLRQANSDWVSRRYGVNIDPETRIMALNGTREGLFNAALALSPELKNGKKPTILVPNPFYQVYAIAALTSGAEPIFVPATRENGFLPDYSGLSEDILNRATIAYICSPANPQGSIADVEYWRNLLSLAEQYDFRIFADECYCEVYRDTPPPGILEIADQVGADPERVVSFHSLSKRSNLPGLRSGFVASGPKNIVAMKRLRSYAGAPLPLPLQRVAERLWKDEAHVEVSRKRYQTKYAMAGEIFSGLQGFELPQGGMFLWMSVSDGEQAALDLWEKTGVRVLPGAYLARDVDGTNPGKEFIRVALVAEEQEMQRGLMAIRDCLY